MHCPKHLTIMSKNHLDNYWCPQCDHDWLIHPYKALAKGVNKKDRHAWTEYIDLDDCSRYSTCKNCSYETCPVVDAAKLRAKQELNKGGSTP